MTDFLEGIKIVDCDTHWQEPADLWTSRVPAKYRDLAPHMVDTARGPAVAGHDPHRGLTDAESASDVDRDNPT